MMRSGKDMDIRKYQKCKKGIDWLLLLAPLVGGGIVWLVMGQAVWAVGAAVLLVLGGLPVHLQYWLDERYMGGVVEDLSRLCESLAVLAEQEVFAENEDTQLSKLQDRVWKLIRMYRRQNEVSRQEQENIKALVSDISHQLKTPLANLNMYTEFLADPAVDGEERAEYMAVVRLSVERLSFLSESMIKISRLESGLIHLHAQTQSINETVLTAVKDVFAKAVERGTEITYQGAEEILVCHDRRWTAEAVFNLLDNAVKYSPPGSVIAVTVRRLGLFMSVDVRDQAPQIAEEERAKIFQRFYRGESGRSAEGLGIGLYLAREIARRQGGYMNLGREEGGNVFSVFFPINV